jgi:hypothetical protein
MGIESLLLKGPTYYDIYIYIERILSLKWNGPVDPGTEKG